MACDVTNCKHKRFRQSARLGRFTPNYLAPDEHGSENDLKSVEEVVPDDDDSGAARGPTFARADGFDAWGGR